MAQHVSGPLHLILCFPPGPYHLPHQAQALAGGSRITTLNLSSNNIGDAGAKALAEMLKVTGVAVYDVCV